MTDRPLPDFDTMTVLAKEIGNLKRSLLIDKARLDQLIAQITEVVMADSTYWTGSKPPSMAYVEATYHIRGLNVEQFNSLSALRSAIADEEGSLKEKELTFQVYRDMIDVWRTESANKRGAYLDA